jgi:hypothetical protein
MFSFVLFFPQFVLLMLILLYFCSPSSLSAHSEISQRRGDAASDQNGGGEWRGTCVGGEGWYLLHTRHLRYCPRPQGYWYASSDWNNKM